MVVIVRAIVEKGGIEDYGPRFNAALERRTPPFLASAGNQFIAVLQRERLSGNPLKVRTGALRGSFTANVVSVPGGNKAVSISTRSPYFRIHDTGGTIRPRTAKFLAIPLDAALTPAGVSRYPSPLRASLPIAFPLGVFVRRGILWGVRSRGRGGVKSEIVPLFALRKQVTIPARIGLDALWNWFEANYLQPQFRVMVLECAQEAARAV